MKKKLFNKIKYVALGDSISEGYSEYFQFGNAGDMDKNNITGTSWPSYLARMLQKINPELIDSYFNFALSSTRIEDWNYFLGVNNKKYSYKNSHEKIDFVKFLVSNSNNPYKNKLKNYFNNFDNKNKNDFDFIIGKIKEANLITFNIGANSVLNKIPYQNLVKSFITNENETIYEIKNNIEKVINNCYEDLSNMIVRLKTLNPNAHIFAIGYICPSNPLFNSINNIFKKFEDIVNIPLATYFIETLNNLIKNVAIKQKINFIDPFNNKFWLENNQTLTEIFYDIHPSVKGYKKMAQDILAKIMLPSKFFDPNNSQIFPTFNNEYLKKDYQCFQNIFNLTKLKIKKEKILSSIYGEKQQNLWINDVHEVSSNKFKQKFFIEKSIQNHNFANLTILEIKKSFIIFIKLLNLNIDNEMQNQIDELFNQKDFLTFLYKNRIISKIFQDIQQNLLNEYKKNTYKGDKHFFEIVIKNSFSIENILNIIKLFVINFEKTSKKKSRMLFDFIINIFVYSLKSKNIKKIFLNISSVIFDSMLQKINISFDKKSFINIIKNINIEEKLESILNELYLFTVSNINKIKKINSTKSLFSFYFLNDYKSLNLFNSFYQIIQNDCEANKNITNIVVKKLNLEKINEKQMKIISEAILVIVQFINANKMIKEAFLQFLVQNIIFSKKEINIYDVLDFIINLDKKTFWSKLTNFNKNKINKKNLATFIDATEIFYMYQNIDSSFFEKIKNLSNYNDWTKDKLNLIKILITLDKFSYLIDPMKGLFDVLYQEYISTKNSNFEIDYQNKYYKFMFRSVLLILLISYQMFQKDINKNIFWNSSSLFKKAPSIVLTIFKFTCSKNEINKNKGKFFLAMLGEENNPNLQNKFNEKTYKKNQLLWYIHSHQKNPICRYTKQLKFDIILKSIKYGYWVLNDDDKK